MVRGALSAVSGLLHLLLLVAPGLAAGPLDEYVSKPEPVYSWRDTGHRVTGLLFGGTATILNVTSLTWLDTSKAIGPNGALWTHQVAVVVPKKLTTLNVSMSVLNGGCNADHYHNGTGPAPP